MKTASLIKIFIVDDHVLVHYALSELINKFEGCRVTGTAANGKEMIRLLEKTSDPDIILLDMNMPVMNGHETAVWLQQDKPGIHKIVLTSYDSDAMLFQFLQTGVKGFLQKKIEPRELENAIKTVFESGFYYCDHTTGKLASFFFHDNKKNNPWQKGSLLSDEDLSLLKLISCDLTYKEIATELNISIRTAESKKDLLCAKLGIKSRFGLAVFALRNGIVSTDMVH